MALSRRPSPYILGTFVFVSCFIASSSLIRASASSDAMRITAVANVTLRATPSSTAAAVSQLPLGTELIESGPAGLDKTWVQVRLPDAREGWVQSSLTRPLDPVWRWPVFDRIIVAAAAAIPARQDKREPYASWLAARVDVIGRDDPADRWMVRPAFIWATHSTYASPTSAADIAILAVP